MLKKKKINKCEVKIKHMSIIICPKVSKVLNTPPQVSPSLMSSPLSNKVIPPLPPPRGIDEQINITCTNMDVNFKKLQPSSCSENEYNICKERKWLQDCLDIWLCDFSSCQADDQVGQKRSPENIPLKLVITLLLWEIWVEVWLILWQW